MTDNVQDTSAETRPPDRSRVPGWVDHGAGLLAIAAVTVLGLQLIRLLFPLVGWFLRDTEGLATLDLVPYGAAPFVLTLLAPVVTKLAGLRWSLIGTIGATALLRLVAQFTDSPDLLLWLAILGATTFLWALPAAYSAARRQFAHGIAVGFVADTAIRGVGWTVDLVWHDGGTALLVVVILALIAVAGAWVTALELPTLDGPRPGAALPMIGLGPLVFLELLVLQNQGWISTQTGWGWDAAFLLIGIGNLVMVLGVSLGRTLPGQGSTGLIGGVLVLLLTAATGLTGVLYAILVLAGMLGAGMVLGALTAPVAIDDRTPSTLAHGLSLAVGWILLFVLAFGYYASYDVALPLPQDLIIIVAGALVTIFGLGASAAERPEGSAHWVAVGVAALLLAVPGLWFRSDPLGQTEPASVSGYPVDVATYNLHSGYSTAGVQDLEAIAAAIEQTGAPIVGLQEVSRGWLLNGSTDMIGWLRRRLGFRYASFHATTPDPVWGNAILSRYPLEETEAQILPQLDSLLRRGVLEADVDLGDGAVLHLMVTHLHHTGDNLEEIHDEQIATILEAWAQETRTVLMGDFNAEPDAPQMQAIYDAGFVDVWDTAGSGPGLTANAADPEVRIDYVLHSPDLNATDARVIESQASDHFAVAATITTAR
ncbi:MAG: endonuclease/exonuclease/phosphatase family protein [Nitriliruptorales bacterium]|nr:endonuclease/exonuclease/phosphatase family protein [Nitriliruptorales bacterium]